MKNQVIIFLSVLSIILFSIVLIQENQIKDTKIELKRVSNNFEIASSTLNYYKTSDSLNALTIDIFKIKLNELKQVNSNLAAKIKQLSIRKKDVISASEIVTETIYNIENKLQDTLIVEKRDTVLVLDTVKYVSYTDKWLSFTQYHKNDSVYTNINVLDSIYLIQKYRRFRFLWFRFGKKKVDETIVSSNPHTKINYAVRVQMID
jgi:hypothetical protein